MKKIMFMALVLISMSAIASESLLALKNPRFTVFYSGASSAVEPYSEITVTIKSCEPRQLEIERKKIENTVFVKVIDLNNTDCRSVGIERDYAVQVSVDAKGESYVLLNPILPEYVR